MFSTILSVEEKILLLVSRTINTPSTPSAYLLSALLKAHAISPKRSIIADTHGVVHWLLLEVLRERPALLKSGRRIVLRTAISVDELVFGSVYDKVWEAMEDATRLREEGMRAKIIDWRANRKEAGRMKSGEDCFFYDSDDESEETENRSDVAARGDRMNRKNIKKLMEPPIQALKRLQESKTAVAKLCALVEVLEVTCEMASATEHSSDSPAGADTLLHYLCRVIIFAIENNDEDNKMNLFAEIMFVEEFARDDFLTQGKEGYALVTFQAAMHFVSELKAEDLEAELEL